MSFAAIALSVGSQQMFVIVCIACNPVFLMTGLTGQYICMTFYVLIGKTEPQMHEMLNRTKFGSKTIQRTQTFDCFS